MDIVSQWGKYKVARTLRRLASPPHGQRQSWTEYQVKDGRKVVSRHDTIKQAEADAIKRIS